MTNYKINLFIKRCIKLYKINYKNLSQTHISLEPKINNVFKLNWDSQALCKLLSLLSFSLLNTTKYKKTKLNKTYKVKTSNKYINKHINNSNKSFAYFNNIYKLIIIRILQKICLEYIKIFKLIENNLEKLETNYLVVLFEGINTIIKIMSNKKNNMNIIQLKSIVLKIFSFIMKNRWNNGLVFFIDGSYRLDITGHMLNGIMI